MNEVVMQSELVAVLDNIAECLCPRKVKWSPLLGNRMCIISHEFADLTSMCLGDSCGTETSDPTDTYLNTCIEAFVHSVQSERRERIEAAALDAAQYIEDGTLTAAQVTAVVRDLANRREELMLGGVHPIDLVSDAEVGEFSALLGEAVRKETVKATIDG